MSATHTNHQTFGWTQAPSYRRPAMTTETVTPAPVAVKATEKRTAIRWATKEVSVEETLGGELFPHESGVAWTPDKGRRLTALEKHGVRAFYVLTRIEGGCDIVIADITGVRKARSSEIPPSVAIKSLDYALGGSFDGELVIPDRIGDSLKVEVSPTSKTGSVPNEALQKFLWNTPPEEL